MENNEKCFSPLHSKKNFIVSYLYEKSKEDAIYDLSIALMSASFLKEKELYSVLIEKIFSLLDTIKNDYAKKWIVARIIFSAYIINDAKTYEIFRYQIVDCFKKNDSLNYPDTYFLVWTFGYVAMTDMSFYQEYEQNMLFCCKTMIENFEENKSDLSSIAWSVIMLLQAAAFFKKQDIFLTCIKMLCFVTKTTSLANSIRYALTHNDSSDYSAWAFAIVFTSAQHIGDENEAIECHGALLQSLEKIKTP